MGLIQIKGVDVSSELWRLLGVVVTLWAIRNTECFWNEPQMKVAFNWMSINENFGSNFLDCSRSNKICFGPNFLSQPDQTGWNWMKPYKTRSNWLKLDEIGSNWWKLDEPGSNWMKPDKMDETGWKGIKLVETGSHRLKLDETWKKQIRYLTLNKVKEVETIERKMSMNYWQVCKRKSPKEKKKIK